MYKYVLFDLDGTLIDPGIGITKSVEYALNKYNITVTDRAELYKFIGPPLQNSFKQFYGFSDEDCVLAVNYYREYFKDKGIYENKIYDGIVDMLKSLKENGNIIILATSKPETFAIKILEHFNLIQYFDFVSAATMDGSRSEKADIIKYALDSNGINNLSSVIMVGDRKYDIIGAKQCNLDSIGVLFGYGSKNELEMAGADFIVETPLEILNVLHEGTKK